MTKSRTSTEHKFRAQPTKRQQINNEVSWADKLIQLIPVVGPMISIYREIKEEERENKILMKEENELQDESHVELNELEPLIRK
jgi:hypothetical protein